MELSEQISISEMAILAELDGIVRANNDIGNGNIGGIRWNCKSK